MHLNNIPQKKPRTGQHLLVFNHPQMERLAQQLCVIFDAEHSFSYLKKGKNVVSPKS